MWQPWRVGGIKAMVLRAQGDGGVELLTPSLTPRPYPSPMSHLRGGDWQADHAVVGAGDGVVDRHEERHAVLGRLRNRGTDAPGKVILGH